MLQNGYGDNDPRMVKHVKHAQTERFRRAGVCEAQLNLRKTADGGNGIYRIFEFSPSVFMCWTRAAPLVVASCGPRK